MIAGFQRKKVVKKRVIASLSLLERDYRPCRGGNLTCPPFGTHERSSFSWSLDTKRWTSQEDAHISSVVTFSP